jgi:hypothetical protein
MWMHHAFAGVKPNRDSVDRCLVLFIASAALLLLAPSNSRMFLVWAIAVGLVARGVIGVLTRSRPPKARGRRFWPRFDWLDERATPTVLSTFPAIVSFDGDGVYSVGSDAASGSTRLGNSPALAIARNNAGDVIASFSNGSVTGTWWYTGTPGAWQQISTYTANSIGFDSQNSVVASFSTIGVWRQARGGLVPTVPYTSLWTQISPAAATAAAVSPQGNHLIASFVGFGVNEWLGGTAWRPISTMRASSLVVTNVGDASGVFEDGHLWFHAGTAVAGSWMMLSSLRATTFDMNAAGVIVASFQNYGVAATIPGSNWQQISTREACDIAVSRVSTQHFIAMPPQNQYDIFAAFGAAGLSGQTLRWKGAFRNPATGQFFPSEPMPAPTSAWTLFNAAPASVVGVSTS